MRYYALHTINSRSIQCSNNQATYHQDINHPSATTTMAYRCLLCVPNVYVAADLGNMKSHLGAPTKHNMGPNAARGLAAPSSTTESTLSI